MNETIEGQLRRVLAQSALAEVPDTAPIPPRRPVDELAVRRAHLHWPAPVLTGIAAACIIAVVATLLVTHRANPPGGVALPPEIATPRVVGLSVSEAEHSIISAGLKVGVLTSAESATVPKGQVAAQQPGQGTHVGKGTPVNLDVSKGTVGVAVADLVSVPSLKTLTVAEATAQLKARHLLMKSVAVTSTASKKGDIVGQYPAANTRLEPGSTVTVQIGNGPNFTTVPTGLVGLPYGQAVAALKAANLTATQQLVDNTKPLNTVVGIGGPNAGESVQQGTPVILQTSNNQLFVVPNLTNLTPADAATRLNALGWRGSVKSFQEYSVPGTDLSVIGKIANGPQDVESPNGSGTVRKPSQDPAAGARVRKTASFTVFVNTKKEIALPTLTPGVTTTDEALRTVHNLGARNIKVITQQPASPPAIPNTYIAMTPGNGSVVDFDAQITITVWGDAPPSPTTR